MKSTKALFAPALAVALFAASGYSAAQTGPTTAGGTGSASTSREVQRGVPGVDADVRTGDRGRQSGVPGVDVDVRNPAAPGGDADTRRSGAGAARGNERPVRADRN